MRSNIHEATYKAEPYWTAELVWGNSVRFQSFPTREEAVEAIAQWAEEVACDEAASPAEVRWQES